ncbi:MAG TPA: HDIG domain-containing protein [Baekduia sp.]|nr:HDIG domain-containing protein [Baekduia sp.]
MTDQTIATFRPGDEVAGVFACVRKDRLVARTGSPYLALELRDSSGAIPARAFRDADALAGRFDRGDLVRVTGRVERFREELQLEVATIVRAQADEADPEEFLPVAYRDRDELEGFLEHLAGEVHDPDYQALLAALLADEALRAEWRRAPCSRNGHHAYLGGLLEHTVAVGTLALEACQLHVKVNSDLLITAALVHDLGRTREFEYGADITISDEGRLLGHIELGLRLLDGYAQQVKLPREKWLALAHCVLTHHGADASGQRRFGSVEAIALYRLNAVDAAIKGAVEHGVGLD